MHLAPSNNLKSSYFIVYGRCFPFPIHLLLQGGREDRASVDERGGVIAKRWTGWTGYQLSWLSGNCTLYQSGLDGICERLQIQEDKNKIFALNMQDSVLSLGICITCFFTNMVLQYAGLNKACKFHGAVIRAFTFRAKAKKYR